MTWIKVEKELPKTGKKVLATFKNELGYKRTICAHYIPKGAVESDGEDETFDYYDEEKDMSFLHEGWYERIENWGEFSSAYVCEGDVTHWMTLPDSPGGGDNG